MWTRRKNQRAIALEERTNGERKMSNGIDGGGALVKEREEVAHRGKENRVTDVM